MKYKALEANSITLNCLQLRGMSAKYINERNPNNNIRESAFTKLLKDLDKALKAAKENQVNGYKSPQTHTGRHDVKSLRKYHENQLPNNKEKIQKEFDEKVIKLHKWLSRQYVWVKSNDWNMQRDEASLSNKDIQAKKTMLPNVIYDHTSEKQNATKIVFDGFTLKNSEGALLDTQNMVSMFSGPGVGIFVISRQGDLHVSSHVVGHYHHSSFTAGNKVWCAGEIKVKRGKIIMISNKSGHYAPTPIYLLKLLSILQERNIRQDFRIDTIERTSEDIIRKSFLNIDSFMKFLKLEDARYEEMVRFATTVGYE